jgi:hypothetical protein
MKTAGTVVLLAVLTAAVMRADDPKAPLADAKQQLRQLQRDETTAKSGTADPSLKGALPDLNATVQGREVLPAFGLDPNLNQKDKDKQRKKDAKKNWLVDGYERLDPKSDTGKPGEPNGLDATTDVKEGQGDAGNQEDFIKLYESQGKSNGGTGSRDKQTVTGNAHTLPADPLAPFLQGWLANSPVRDAALQATVVRSEGTPGSTEPPPPTTGIEAPMITANVSATVLPGGGDAKADNPYLLSLTMPFLTGNSPSSAPMFPVGSPDSSMGMPAAKPTAAGPADDLLTSTKSEPRKPPLNPADEDKKYFPQMKRF